MSVSLGIGAALCRLSCHYKKDFLKYKAKALGRDVFKI